MVREPKLGILFFKLSTRRLLVDRKRTKEEREKKKEERREEGEGKGKEGGEGRREGKEKGNRYILEHVSGMHSISPVVELVASTT